MSWQTYSHAGRGKYDVTYGAGKLLQRKMSQNSSLSGLLRISEEVGGFVLCFH